MRSLSALLIATFLMAISVTAGDLSPPAGPIQSTQRGQIRSLPFTISSSGSYVVMADLTGTAGSNGITIAADHVTLDLNGFSLIGVPGSLAGVADDSARTNITIRNGSVRSWANDGIDLETSDGVRVLSVKAMDNGGRGIDAGTTAQVIGCFASGNGAGGVATAGYSMVLGTIARINTGDGITMNGAGASLVQRCVANQNTGTGAVLNSVTLASDSSFNLNSANGVSGLGLIQGCVAYSNTAAGVVLGDNAVADRCRAISNDVGVALPNTNATAVRNYVGGNTTSAISDTGTNSKVGTIATSPVGAGPWDNQSP